MIIQVPKPITDDNFNKDLDNLMLHIIPPFTEIFKPPLLGGRRKLKQIASYEIIELDHSQFDFEDGAVYINIVTPEESLMSQISNQLDEMFDSIL